MSMPTAEQVRAALRRVVDPEIGLDIVDLGLVYGIDIDAGSVRISMTTTSQACPTAGMMADEARAAVAALAPGVAVDVTLVWEPPWEPACMSESAKQKLGW